MATVSALTVYPVKGCAGVVVERSEVVPTGLAHDRLFAVVGSDGGCLWQGGTPRLSLIRAQVRDGGAALVLSAPDAGEVVVDVVVDGPTRPVEVERWPGHAVDQGDHAARWLSEVLDGPVRLVRAPVGGHDPADPEALHVLSLSSLDDLNARIAARGADPLPMDRFRPNVVISGWPDPYTEDRVARLRLGGAELAYGAPAIRCAVTLVDQPTGVRAGPEPLRTLADYRRVPEGVSFGLKASVRTPGEVAVGDPVTVTEWRTEP